MLVYVKSAKCIGINAVPVTIEVDITLGIGIHLVGLADAAVKESLLRTVTALQSKGFHIPGKKIVINLAPADLHKQGSGYDLPIALGIIAASGQAEVPRLGDFLICGELSLDASIRRVGGALPMAEMARKSGCAGCIFPVESAVEAAEYEEGEIYGVSNLDEVLRILSGEVCEDLLIRNSEAWRLREDDYGPVGGNFMDVKDIVGQEGAKRGIEIAAAGGHNVIMVGSPGSGKSSLAKAMAGILPPMSREEAVITSKIYSVAGKGRLSAGLMRARPFRAPHHSCSQAALLGGGSGENIVPGEVSLANGGILFMDEFSEAPKGVVEALRGPLEDRKVTVSRLKAKIEYPASFMLVAASNPCPCGYYGEDDRCSCSPGQRVSYLQRLSGPILDRIDIQLYMRSVPAGVLVRGEKGESSAAVAARVRAAREIQLERFRFEPFFTNAEMNSSALERYCPLDDESKNMLEGLIDKLGLSARAYTRIVKIARTIADLECVSGAPGGAGDGSRAWGADGGTTPWGADGGTAPWGADGGTAPGDGSRAGGAGGVTRRPALAGPILPRHLAEAASFRFLDRRNIWE